MTKEIHFYLDCYKFTAYDALTTWDKTLEAIKRGDKIIHITSLMNLYFGDLLDDGYRIFVHRNGKTLECKVGYMEGTEKEIRHVHDIRRMIVAGVFDDYFNN